MSIRAHRAWRVVQPWLAALVAAGVVVVGLVLVSAAPAQATVPAGVAQAASDAEVVRVPLRLDCTNMSTKAQEYAVAHGYCPTRSDVRPGVVVWGNCGWSAMFLSATGTSGTANMAYGFGSTLGTVVYRSLAVTWRNTAGPSGAFPDSGVMFNTNYGAARLVPTGAGWVRAELTGSVLLVWGGLCTIAGTFETAVIT
jgi:hypothetical protein